MPLQLWDNHKGGSPALPGYPDDGIHLVHSMKHAEFVHLHVHTQYSLLDGAIRLDDLMHKAKEYHMPAITMTDHGNMFGTIDFYEKATKTA